MIARSTLDSCVSLAFEVVSRVATGRGGDCGVRRQNAPRPPRFLAHTPHRASSPLARTRTEDERHHV